MNKHYNSGSNFTGGILMCNRATKDECLKRKLFGLPSSRAKYIKQLRAGMLLFLFEYEERKLYGVFEATSDGEMNIVPNAFRSSGKSFPAQVLFRRIWHCRSLSEDEFCHAIIDNYYAAKKFHFNLSCNQVFKLIQLFSLRRINLHQYTIPDMPNEIIRKFERCHESRERNTSQDFRDSRRISSLSGSSIKISMPSKRSTQRKSCTKCSSYKHHDHHHFQDSSTYSLDCSSLSQEPISHVGSSNTDIQPYHFNGPSCPSSFTAQDYELEPDFERYDPSKSIISFSLDGSNYKGTNNLLMDCNSSDKNLETSYLFSPLKDRSDNIASEFVEEPMLYKDLENTSPDLESDSDEHYPSVITSKLHSDIEKSRTSVFSRLSSMDPNKEAVIDVDAFIKNAIAEANVVLADAKLTLKRRRENEKHSYADSSLDEGTQYKYKRLEMSRPSGSEKECVQVRTPETVQVKPMAGNKIGSAMEASLGDSDSCSTGKDIPFISGKKEITNRNLLWFLQKSINAGSEAM